MGIREMVLDRAKREGNREGKIEGKIEGKEESQVSVVTNLILTKRFTPQEIAGFVDVPESFVLNVMRSLNL